MLATLEKKEEEKGNGDGQRKEEEVASVSLEEKGTEGVNGEDQVVVDIEGGKEEENNGTLVTEVTHRRERREGGQ